MGLTALQVRVDGEAWFDVVHNADFPFVVQTSKMNIKVLGTSFNVIAYSFKVQRHEPFFYYICFIQRYFQFSEAAYLIYDGRFYCRKIAESFSITYLAAKYRGNCGTSDLRF